MDFSFGCPVFRGSPIPLPIEPGAAGLHLRLSRFPTVTHPTADRARCCLTPLQVVTYPSAVLARFRPSWTCSPGPVLKLSRFSAVTHPTADQARCCLTLFFDCLLFRWSPIQVPTWPGAAGLHLWLFHFWRSPIPLPTKPGAA